MRKCVFSIIVFFGWMMLFIQCYPKDNRQKLVFYSSQKNFYKTQGRTRLTDQGELELISAASQLAFVASGRSVEIPMYTVGSVSAYVSIFINGIELDRYSVAPADTTWINVVISDQPTEIKLIKDTEAITGVVVVPGVWAEKLQAKPVEKELLIEFIGNSITSAMGADTTDVSCGSGQWYDQHRASYSYGSISADSLDVDFILNSVSGYGIYRNWNDENIEEPTLPQVYDNLYLNSDSNYRYRPARNPDLISICLGTNDLSAGNGVKPRLPFNINTYVNTYAKFVQKLFDRDQSVKIVLLTSPMVKGNNAKLFKEALTTVSEAFENKYDISIFEFNEIIPTGCSYHPLAAEHKLMADQLIPVYRNLLKR